MNGLIAAILAGGQGERLGHLTADCPKPLVPYAGTCRMIDFSLENCRASGIAETVLMAKHMAPALVDYLRSQWSGSLQLNFGHWEGDGRPLIDEQGTADALINNRPFLDQPWTRDILVLHSDHIYNFDYRPMYAHHLNSGAALTLGFQRIPIQFVSLFGMVDFDRAGHLTAFVEKPKNPTSDCVFTAVAIFNKQAMYRYLDRLAAGPWKHDISFDLIPAMLANGEGISGYHFTDYWEDIGTCERYFHAHLRLVDDHHHLHPPITLAGGAGIALMATPQHDHVIMPQSLQGADFTARRSFIFPGACIGSHAHLDNCVLLPGAEVCDGEQLANMLISPAGRSAMEPVHG